MRHALSLGAFISGFGASVAQAATIAHYRFEDGSAGATIATAADLGSNPMAATGAPVYYNQVFGSTVPQTGASNNLAASYVGGGRHHTASTTGALAATPFTSFTIETYVRFNALGGFQTLVGRDDSGNPGQGTGATALFYLSKGSGDNFRVELTTASNVTIQVNSNVVPVAGSWYHVAAVGDAATGTLSLYVNGTLAGSTSGFNGLFVPTSGTCPWTLGRGYWGTFQVDPLDGYLDEVRFSDAALTPQQFLNYNSGAFFAFNSVPVGGAFYVGQTVTLSSSTSTSATYQWQRSLNGGSSWSNISGATSPDLVFAPISYGDTAQYRVQATSGATTLTSDPVTVTVSYPAPAITLGSANIAPTVLVGTDVTFDATATGIGNITYQWSRNGVPITGATSPLFPLGLVGAAQGGSYTVVVSDDASTASGLPATTVTKEYNLSVITSAEATVAYYRFEDGTADAQISSAVDSTGTASNAMGSAGVPTYTASVPGPTVPRTGAPNTLAANLPVTGNNNLLSSLGGSLDSTAFGDFTLETYARITSIDGWQTIVGRDDTGSPGEGTGVVALFYLSKSGVNNGLRVELITKSNRNIQINSNFLTNPDTWYHVAVVGNSLTGTLGLYVDGVLVGTTSGFDGLFVPSSGANAPWTLGRGYWSGLLVDYFRGFLDEVRFSKVALRPSQFLRSSTDSDLPPPSIVSAPVSTTVRKGVPYNLTVSATAAGTGNLTYQWSLNGTPISGATGSTLSRTGALSEAGNYTVTVFDDAGVAAGFSPTSASASFTLVVLDVPAAGRVLGLNFVGASTGSGGYATDAGIIQMSEVAGFLPTGNWSNSSVGVASAEGVSLVESNGAATVAKASWASAETWASLASGGAAADKSPDRRLFHGYIQSRSVAGSSVTVANVPYASYDVYVYVGGGALGNVGVASIDRAGAPAYYYRLISNNNVSSGATPLPYMIATATTLSGAQAAPAASFVRFAAVTGSDVTVTVADAVLNASAGGIAAVQIVDRTPAGTAYPPTVTVAPVSQLKAGGSSTSFTVAANSNNSGGVLSYQWQKDGSPLSGQTSATLSLSGLTGSSTGIYSVVITDNSSLGAASATRSASLVVVDATRPLLINGDVKAAGVSIQTGNGILRTTGASNDALGSGGMVWNGVLAGAGTATRSLAKESTGLAIPGVSFTYGGAEGVEDDNGINISGSPLEALSRDYLYTDSQTTSLTGSISGLDALVGQEVTLLVYAYGKTSTAFFSGSSTSDTATVTLASANNHLASPPYTTGTGDYAGRNIADNNLITTEGATAAYATFTGVVGPGGTVSWSIGPDGDAGRIPLVGFQLLLTGNNLAPAVPTGLAAVAGNNQVSLTWNTVSGANTYTIGRSTNPAGPYTTLSAGAVVAGSYLDNTAVNGTTYYYVVASAKTSPAVQSPFSSAVSATLSAGTSAQQAWRQTHFGTTANTGSAANTADPDADGQVNLLEYALGTDPTVAGASQVALGRSGGGMLTLTFSPVVDTHLSYAIEAGSDLTGAWSTVHTYGSFASTAPVTYTDTVVPGSVNSRRFLRLKVTSTE